MEASMEVVEARKEGVEACMKVVETSMTSAEAFSVEASVSEIIGVSVEASMEVATKVSMEVAEASMDAPMEFEWKLSPKNFLLIARSFI